MIGICHDLIVEEVGREFASGLRTVDLPPVPDRHQLRFRETITAMGTMLSIAQCATLVGRAIRGADKARQTHPLVPREKMTVHAVNRLVGEFDRAVGQGFHVDAAAPSSGFASGLSGLTSVVFRVLMSMDPGQADLGTALALLEVPLGSGPRAKSPDPAATILDRELCRDPHVVYRALKRQQELSWDAATASAIDEVIGLVERLEALTGDLRTALAATMCAVDRPAALLPVLSDSRLFISIGKYLTDVMLGALAGGASSADL
ncbi:MAG: hypothetical protein JXA67_05895 [Micromonosporaceae bacterium]|nr:hypothetical protein [Micromonosporaceae bacterium]